MVEVKEAKSVRHKRTSELVPTEVQGVLGRAADKARVKQPIVRELF